MKGLKTTLYKRSEQLPALDESNFFHSRELFDIARETPRQKPVMVVTTDAEGHVVSHMLGIIRYRTLVIPPFLIIHCRVLGEGVYYDSPYKKEELFGEMLTALKSSMSTRTLYMEVSNLSQKMFGYKQLRQLQFFPVNWSSVHNSLHSHAPEERISSKLQKRIRKIMEGEHGRLFVTKYRGKVIACSACVYSMGDAYLWYSAFRRKTYRFLHPDVVVVWDVMKHAYENGYAHMCFMDVGLPFSKNPFREFILRFGGKEQSTYRWFRFSIRWINSLLSWLYRE